ncbi:hypothetical protein [Nonomuraea endophytica]|uniref:Uncharacterized protein n=1 Tax=Nonomuraea endophytica TaxID=714136 RepID=A0A7W8A918_9ACTN|nr:hypothetical protein [Nonomuraea endophytica]MBB5081244.1 hypothetical protein [Nonomuraea endophytica]
MGAVQRPLPLNRPLKRVNAWTLARAGHPGDSGAAEERVCEGHGPGGWRALGAVPVRQGLRAQFLGEAGEALAERLQFLNRHRVDQTQACPR